MTFLLSKIIIISAKRIYLENSAILLEDSILNSTALHAVLCSLLHTWELGDRQLKIDFVNIRVYSELETFAVYVIALCVDVTCTHANMDEKSIRLFPLHVLDTWRCLRRFDSTRS